MSELPNVRHISASQLRKVMGRQKGQCTWCGEAVGKGRQTWCGDKCVEAFRERYDAGYIRRLVLKRDRGICRLCGRDTDHWNRLWDRWQRSRSWAAVYQASMVYWRGKRNRRGRRNSKRLLRMTSWRARKALRAAAAWEADHIVPVCEGGAKLGIDNIRTLCSACHKRETAKLAAARAEKRARAKREARVRDGSPVA